MRKCAHCRQESNDNGPFCGFCGAAMPVRTLPPIAQPQLDITGIKPLPPIKVKPVKSNPAVTVLCMILALALIAMIVFVLAPVLFGLPFLNGQSAASFQNERFGELFEIWLDDANDYDQFMGDFAKIAHLNGVPVEDYLTAGKVLRSDPEKMIAIVSLGITKTNHQSLLDYLDKAAPLEERLKGYEHEELFEEVFGKPVSELTWHDTNRVKYLYISGDDFIYSMYSPNDFKNEDEFKETLVSLTFNPDRVRSVYCWMFTGCETLNTSFPLGREMFMGKPVRLLTVAARYSLIPRIANYPESHPYALEHFAVLPNLEYLEIESDYITDVGDMSRMSGLAQLKFDYWCAAGPYDPPMNPLMLWELGTAPHLTYLELKRHRITGGGEDLSGLNIEALVLNQCDLQSAVGMDSMPKLKSLRITQCQAKYFDFIATYHNLSELRIEGCNAVPPMYGDAPANLRVLTLDKAVSLEQFAGCTKLESLTVEDAEALVYMGGFHNLSQLTLTGNGVSYDLSALSVLPELKAVTIDSGQDGFSIAALNLEGLADFPALEKLTMRRVNEMSGLKELVHSNQLTGLHIHKSNISYGQELFDNADDLKQLSITDIRLDGDAGERLLSRIGRLYHLEYLDVSNTSLSDLSFLRELTVLREFYARDNFIQDTSVLSSLPNLKTTDLSNNLVY